MCGAQFTAVQYYDFLLRLLELVLDVILGGLGPRWGQVVETVEVGSERFGSILGRFRAVGA